MVLTASPAVNPVAKTGVSEQQPSHSPCAPQVRIGIGGTIWSYEAVMASLESGTLGF